MTTTHDVPMPEPDVTVAIDTDGIPRSLQGRFYTAGQVRDTAIKYADARCAKLQEESQEWRALAIAIADDLNDERIAHRALAEKVKAMEANDRRYRWLRGGYEKLCATRLDGNLNQIMIVGNELDAAIDAAGGGGEEAEG